MSKEARLSDVISALEKKQIAYKTWHFASGAISSIECDGVEIWSRSVENESHGILIDESVILVEAQSNTAPKEEVIFAPIEMHQLELRGPLINQPTAKGKS